MLEYENEHQALRGAIYTLREAAKREELPAWLRYRLTTEADACEVCLRFDKLADIREECKAGRMDVRADYYEECKADWQRTGEDE